mgnify:CR=1 FL=1
MRKFLALIVILVLAAVAPVQARQRVCDPFTTTPDAGMLPIGQVVEFAHWEGASAPVTRTGKIVKYYIQACWPGVPVIGLDPQAYVVDYGSADGSQVVLNRSAVTVR